MRSPISLSKSQLSGRWRAVLGGGVFAVLLYFVFRGFNYGRFFAVIGHAEIGYVALIPATILVEQAARAWKWAQILSPVTAISSAATLRALMAGYVPGLAVGMGTSVLTRAWLVARRDPRLTTGAVIATVTVDRLIDSIAFVLFVGVALVTTTLPASADRLRVGLALGAIVSLIAAALVLFALFSDTHRLTRLPQRLEFYLPRRWRAGYFRFTHAFAQGIAFPREPGRRLIVVIAAALIKLLAIAQFLWAGLAIGIVLPAPDYIFIMVFLGLWVLIGFVVQIPGSSILATIFVLGLFGIAREQALAMTLMVGGAFLLSYGAGGAVALWLEGVSWRELRAPS